MQLQTIERKSKKRNDDIHMEVVDVTPSIAAAWLDRNNHNRKVSSSTVNTYKRDMLAGKWRMDGAPIRFDVDGEMLDGQHRCLACVAADVSFRSLVIYGLTKEASVTIDSGRPRTASNVLQMAGTHNANKMAAASRIILDIAGGSDSPGGGGLTGRRSTSEIMSVINAHPLLSLSVVATDGVKGCSVPTVTALHYLAANMMGVEETANAFVRVFKSGVPDYDGCAAHALRERVIRSVGSVNQIPRAAVIVATISSWNHFARKTPILKFNLPRTQGARMEGLDIMKLRESLK